MEQKLKVTFEAIQGQILLDFNGLLSVFYSYLSTPNLTGVCMCCCCYCFRLVCFVFIKTTSFSYECSFCIIFPAIYIITLQIFSCNLCKQGREHTNWLLVKRQHNWWKKCPDAVRAGHRQAWSFLAASDIHFTERVETAWVNLLGSSCADQLENLLYTSQHLLCLHSIVFLYSNLFEWLILYYNSCPPKKKIKLRIFKLTLFSESRGPESNTKNMCK